MVKWRLRHTSGVILIFLWSWPRPISLKCDRVRLLRNDFHPATFDTNARHPTEQVLPMGLRELEQWSMAVCTPLPDWLVVGIIRQLQVITSEMMCANLGGPNAPSCAFTFRWQIVLTLFVCVLFFFCCFLFVCLFLRGTDACCCTSGRFVLRLHLHATSKQAMSCNWTSYEMCTRT